jgi:hypothetical protein
MEKLQWCLTALTVNSVPRTLLIKGAPVDILEFEFNEAMVMHRKKAIIHTNKARNVKLLV